jgi:2-(1,2-epoxy-1,2-dihydrophenyl)acetyl-CoA isomerase
MGTIDTGTDHLHASVDDGVAVLTMNRPERRNALSGEMLGALGRALERVEKDREIRCVVVTGAGGAFCAGGDVKGFAANADRANGASEGPTIDERIHAQRLDQRATSGALWRMPKPTIAAIGGPAAGAGLAIALACDLRVMVDSAILTTAFARVGFSGDYGGSWFLTQLVGPSKAKELYYLSSRIGAQEALSLGLVNRVLAAAEYEEAWRALARQLASGPSIAYRSMKENINRAAVGIDAMEAMDLEVTHHVHCGQTDDHKNASKAFVEKREPVFTGR